LPWAPLSWKRNGAFKGSLEVGPDRPEETTSGAGEGGGNQNQNRAIVHGLGQGDFISGNGHFQGGGSALREGVGGTVRADQICKLGRCEFCGGGG